MQMSYGAFANFDYPERVFSFNTKDYKSSKESRWNLMTMASSEAQAKNKKGRVEIIAIMW
jgi:hypothetical protein